MARYPKRGGAGLTLDLIFPNRFRGPIPGSDHLWADLDQCDPLELPYAESMEIARNWVEHRRVMQFLKGLNQGFESRHVALSHLVSLDEAIPAMYQVEVRLQSRRGHGNESAFRVTNQ